jgi:hypothetical protein
MPRRGGTSQAGPSSARLELPESYVPKAKGANKNKNSGGMPAPRQAVS